MSENGTPGAILTKRELQVLRLAWDGFSAVEIGKRLSLSRKTVEFHRNHVYKKLGVNDVVSAVRKGLNLGLLEP